MRFAAMRCDATRLDRNGLAVKREACLFEVLSRQVSWGIQKEQHNEKRAGAD